MADIRPLGSERLNGLEKIQRIMEIARYKETQVNSVNENSSTHYDITLADGNKFGIIKEKQGYIIKKILSEGQSDYIEPIKNRKYFSSYSQALKKLNLMIKENNNIVGNDEEVKLFGEQKKFVLKTPNPPAPEPPAEPAPAAAPELPAAELPAAGDEAPPVDDAAIEDVTTDVETTDTTTEVPETGDEGPVTFKSIQKLTGKLTQKIRQFASENEMSSEDVKYVINMVLSSVDLNTLSTEDRDEIMGKFEADEDMSGDDKGGTDYTDDTEVEDIQASMDTAVDQDSDFQAGPELGEGADPEGETDEQWQAAVARAAVPMIASYVGSKMGENNEEVEENKTEMSIMDHLFSESKVDKVLSKYFDLNESEKKSIEEKKIQKTKMRKAKIAKVMESVKNLAESVEQQLAAEKFIEENPSFSFIGKTNKKNLVFEGKNKQTKISPEGILV